VDHSGFEQQFGDVMENWDVTIQILELTIISGDLK